MQIRLEHANLCVRDIEVMIRFFKTAFPEFRARGEGKSRDGTRWVHVGTNDTYIALGQAKADSERHWMPYSGEPGVNHLAYEVDDRKRVYFYDPEGNDWEFVQYFSQDPAERNDYELPDS